MEAPPEEQHGERPVEVAQVRDVELAHVEGARDERDGGDDPDPGAPGQLADEEGREDARRREGGE